jgi:hypothetical protein
MATRAKTKAHVEEIRLAVNSQMPFDQLVKVLKATLTVPELPGIRGCSPCLSGLARVVLDDIAMGGR